MPAHHALLVSGRGRDVQRNGALVPELISRKTAKAHGLKRYFTGKPCRNGHIAQRYVLSCGPCVECIRIRNGSPAAHLRFKNYNDSPKGQERSRRAILLAAQCDYLQGLHKTKLPLGSIGPSFDQSEGR